MSNINFQESNLSKYKKLSDASTWIASYRDGETLDKQKLNLLSSVDRQSPVQGKNQSCSVIFDGVLYNRKELSDRFNQASGYILNDAELIIAAYRYWGEDVLQQIKGIFALILFDSAQDILLCARDRVGFYPLFYANLENEWLFSSSIESLTKHSRILGKVNRAALADHLCHRWPDVEETFFQNIKRVPPGHVMKVREGNSQVCRYWNLPTPGVDVDWIKEEELGLFDEFLDLAVQRCLDRGAAAIFLSGGLDSVSVAAVATEISHSRGMSTPWALSLGFPGEWNEEEIQKGVAKDLGLSQVLLPFEKAVNFDGLLLSALKMSSNWSVPLQSPWNSAYYQLGLEGKQRDCQVILTGGGGDEWLGITPLLAADLIRNLDFKALYELWSSLQRSYQIPWHLMMNNMLWRFGVRPLLGEIKQATVGKAIKILAPEIVKERRRRRTWQGRPEWAVPDMALRQEIERRLELSWNKQKQTRKTGSFYLKELWEPFDHPLTTMEMEEIFENGTRLGLSIMMPYWDSDLIETLYRVPPSLLIKGGRSKGLVRESIARRFPQLGFEKQKKVIATNFFNTTMIKEGRKAWQMLDGVPALAELGIVDRQNLDLTMQEILAGNLPEQAYRIWDILNLEAWLQPRL